MGKGSFVSPSRLTAAREFRGLTKRALATELGLQPMTISGYEKGDWQPARDVLEHIARFLQFPLTWFLQDEMALVDVHAPTFRAQSRMTSCTRGQSARTWDIAAVISLKLRDEFNVPAVWVPDLSEETPEAAARMLRDEWRLSKEPIPNMVHLLESKGIMVFWTDIPSRSVDACCHWFEDNPIVLLNTNESAGERLRFNAAHELGHLVLHRERKVKPVEPEEVELELTATLPGLDPLPATVTVGDEGEDDKDDARVCELEANRFASAFLMPQSAWTQASPLQPVLEAFLDLKPVWKVSIQAMIRRSYDLQLMTEYQYEKAMTRVSVNGWRKAEPGVMPVEQSLLHKKVFELMRKQGVTTEEFAADVHLYPDDLVRLMPVAAQYTRRLVEVELDERAPVLRFKR